MAKNMLIFGGGGFVGGNLATIANQKGWQVSIADRTIKPGLDFATWTSVDITNDLAVKEIINRINPDIVVNLAAMAAIDKAEQEREQTWAVNVDGAKNVRREADDKGFAGRLDRIETAEAVECAFDSFPNVGNGRVG